jgi:hypothetical protein
MSPLEGWPSYVFVAGTYPLADHLVHGGKYGSRAISAQAVCDAR